LFRIEPTSAASELLVLVESLGIEREFFGVLTEIGIVWKTISSPCLNNHSNKETVPLLSVLKNDRFELINLFLDCSQSELYSQLEWSVGVNEENFTSKTLHELILGNFGSPVIQIVAIDKDNKGFLGELDEEKWLNLEMTLLKANNPILIVLGWKNSVVQASELKMQMIIKNKPVAVISMSDRAVNIKALTNFLVEFYGKLRVVELDMAFEKAKQMSRLVDR